MFLPGKYYGQKSGLQSMGLQRVGHDCMHACISGESQGRGEPGGLPSMGLRRVGHD